MGQSTYYHNITQNWYNENDYFCAAENSNPGDIIKMSFRGNSLVIDLQTEDLNIEDKNEHKWARDQFLNAFISIHKKNINMIIKDLIKLLQTFPESAEICKVSLEDNSGKSDTYMIPEDWGVADLKVPGKEISKFVLCTFGQIVDNTEINPNLKVYEDIKFDKSDWDSFHDLLININPVAEKIDMELMVKEFNSLPDNLQREALHWGMSDTPWRDNVYTWYKENNTL